MVSEIRGGTLPRMPTGTQQGPERIDLGLMAAMGGWCWIARKAAAPFSTFWRRLVCARGITFPRTLQHWPSAKRNSKAAEQAARIAGVLTLWRDLDAHQVQPSDMADAITLAQFYLSEASRLASASTVSAENRQGRKPAAVAFGRLAASRRDGP